MSAVLNDARRFYREGHRELVILKFAHYQGFQEEAYKDLVSQIKTSLGPWLYKVLPKGKRLADVTLSEFVRDKGAIVVACDDSYPLNHRCEGIWVYRDWDSGHPEEGDLRVYDQYSDSMTYLSMKADQFDKFNRYDGKCQARRDVVCDLFLLSWTLTPPTYVRGYSVVANRKLEADLKELKRPNHCGYFVNLLYADYVESAIDRRGHPAERNAFQRIPNSLTAGFRRTILIVRGRFVVCRFLSGGVAALTTG